MAAEVQMKERSPSQKEFENLLNEDFKDRNLKEGEICPGIITEITKKHIILDFRLKQEAMIPIAEFVESGELENLKVGSEVACYIERFESFKGELIVSYTKAKRLKVWKELEEIAKTGKTLTATLQGKIKGGFYATYKSLPCFVPASQLSLAPTKRVDHLMGQPLEFVVSRIDSQRGNASLSRRELLERGKEDELKEAIKDLKEGQIVTSKVRATVEWGIFLDINGAPALLHVSDCAWGRVKKPSDMVTIGQDLKVKITKITNNPLRISASVKALTDDPYDNLEKKYEVGKVYKATVVKLMQYGAFARLEDSIEGLIHQSMLTFENRNIEPSKVLSVSQEISVRIVAIDKELKRISLSYKDNGEFENPWDKVKDKVGSKVSCKISNITEKAIFLEIENTNLVGMCHYKELDWSESSEQLKLYKKGQTVSAKLIEIKDEKIRLSIRALQPSPWDWFKDNNKKLNSVISTKVVEVLRTGVKVAIDPDKKIITTIKKSHLAIESADCRPEIYGVGNVMSDAKIIELDIENKKVTLSPKEAAKDEQASLMAKFGAKASSSGATLKGIFDRAKEKALGKKKNDKN